MTKTQLSFLLTAIYVYERRRDAVSQVEVEAWHQLLADVDFDDAKTVVTEYFADSDRPLSPAKLRAGARALQAQRRPPERAADRLLVPDADPDDPEAFIEAVRGRRYLPARDPQDFEPRVLELPAVRGVEAEPEITPKSRPRRWWLLRGRGQEVAEGSD